VATYAHPEATASRTISGGSFSLFFCFFQIFSCFKHYTSFMKLPPLTEQPEAEAPKGIPSRREK
jgi:hypothetical protein